MATKVCAACGRRSQSRLCDSCYKGYKASGESLDIWVMKQRLHQVAVKKVSNG